MPRSLFSRIKIQVLAAASTLLTLILIGTISYRIIEGWTWIQSFYFSVITLTTVGYGDLHPTSDLSRLFTAFYILIGVSISIGAIGIIGGNYLAKREKAMIEKRKKREKHNQ